MYKFKVGQRVSVTSVAKLAPWGKPTRRLGYTFVISKISESIPSRTPLYFDGDYVIAAEPNLSPVYTALHTRILK